MKCHGFNYGVGGGHGHLAEAILTGLAAREDDNVPGVWVVATQFSPEAIPDELGQCSNDPVGHAVALAITASGAAHSRLNLRLTPTATAGASIPPDVVGDEPESGLVKLGEFLTADHAGHRVRRWYCPLAGFGTLQLDDDPSRAAQPSGEALAG
jgi:hypothetical protein